MEDTQNHYGVICLPVEDKVFPEASYKTPPDILDMGTTEWVYTPHTRRFRNQAVCFASRIQEAQRPLLVTLG